MGVRGGWGVRRVVALAAIALLVSAVPATAQNLEDYDYDNLGLWAIGVEALFVEPSQSESTIGFGVKLDLGQLGPHVRVIPRFGYWKADVEPDRIAELEAQLEDVSGLPPGAISLGDIERSAYVFGLDIQYIRELSSLSPYVGAGLDVYALNDDGAAIGGTFLDETIITAGVSAVGGLQLALTRNLAAFAEFRATAATGASSLGAAAGLFFTFGD